MGFWDKVFARSGRSIVTDLLTNHNTNLPIYPDSTKNKYYVDSFSGNGDVFAVLNRISDPASRLPIQHVDDNDEPIKNSKTLALLDDPNPFQTRTEFIKGSLTIYNIFGNYFMAGQTPEFGLRSGQLTRLDILPPQWVEIVSGDYNEPIKGYKLNINSENKVVDYLFQDVLHWKEFNPNYKGDGSHLYGMSRLRPALQSIAASTSGYDAMVSSFQNMGAYGVLSILGVKDSDGKLTQKASTGQQLNDMEKSWAQKYTGRRAFKKLAITNKSVEWTPFGMSPVDLAILDSVLKSRGQICDIFAVPDELFSNSEGTTFSNMNEAKKSLWSDAIMPTFDSFLDSLGGFVIPRMGEKGRLIANYDNVEALQEDKAKKVAWMVNARLTGNEIREAIGYEPLPLNNMDLPLVTFGDVPIDQIGVMPSPEQTEKALDKLGIEDYRN